MKRKRSRFRHGLLNIAVIFHHSFFIEEYRNGEFYGRGYRRQMDDEIVGDAVDGDMFRCIRMEKELRDALSDSLYRMQE